MNIMEIVLMWVWLAVAFAIVTKWPMGKVSDLREKYWARYKS